MTLETTFVYKTINKRKNTDNGHYLSIQTIQILNTNSYSDDVHLEISFEVNHLEDHKVKEKKLTLETAY